MAAWKMLSVSLRSIPIDFEWNECGVNVMVRVGLMDIERGREWVRVDGWCQFRRIPSVLRVPPADCGLGYPLHGHEGEARAFELLAGGGRRPSGGVARWPWGRASGRVTPSRSPFWLRLAECRRRRVLSQRRRRVILAPGSQHCKFAAGAPACSRAKRRCGAITYHANKPQHLNPCSWSSRREP